MAASNNVVTPERQSLETMEQVRLDATLQTILQQLNVRFKDNVLTVPDLPATGNQIDDHRLVIADGYVRIRDGAARVFPSVSGGSGGNYTPQGTTTATVGGIASGTNLGTTPVTIQSILDLMLYPAVGPTTTLSTNPVGGLFENGDSIAQVDLSSTTTPGNNPIAAPFTFSRSGTGVIFTDATPNPAGGVEVYSDLVPVTTTTTYTASVTDGTLTGTATATFTFVSAWYYGVAAPGLNIAVDGGGLIKVVQGNVSSYTTTTSPVNQVYYIAYPDSFPALTSILDTNGFETISDYTVTTGIAVTNSFGNIDTYRLYEFNNLTTQTNFHNTYIQ